MSSKREKDSVTGRSYIGVHYECCQVYSRVYLKQEQKKQISHCPKCGNAFHIKFSENGTDSPFWLAG